MKLVLYVLHKQDDKTHTVVTQYPGVS